MYGKSNLSARRLLFRNSVTRREMEEDTLSGGSRQRISSSFDSSYPSALDPTAKLSQGSLIKPRSVATLRPPPQRMNSLHSPDGIYMVENCEDRKLSRAHPSTTSNSSLLSSRKASSPNHQKITRRPHSTDGAKMAQTAAGGGSGSVRNGVSSTQKPSSVSTTKLPSISASSQSIILFCMDNARSDIALRIVQRMAHKRDDFAQFYANLSSEQSSDLVVTLKKFLNDIVQNIGSSEKIRGISSQYGAEQAHKRSWGFRADFFAVLADALTTECVFLDGAAHQPTETIEAWATLVELMFTHVRDGYYQQIRLLRKNLQNFSSPSNVSSQSDQSFDGDSSQIQPSPRHMPATPHSFSSTNSEPQAEISTPRFSQPGFLRS